MYVNQFFQPMKKNDSINFLFLFLCILLMGFVYLSGKMPEHTLRGKHSTVQQTGETVKIR